MISRQMRRVGQQVESFSGCHTGSLCGLELTRSVRSADGIISRLWWWLGRVALVQMLL